MERKIHSETQPGVCTAAVYYSPEWEEYTVVLRDTRGIDRATYFTEAKDDAMGTARAMVAEFTAKSGTTN